MAWSNSLIESGQTPLLASQTSQEMDPIPTSHPPHQPNQCWNFLSIASPTHALSVPAHVNLGDPLPTPGQNHAAFTNNPLHPAMHVSASRMWQYDSGKEYSIFVGDLAPEASNSDLVLVFKHPVLGLRNDREPKLIRPFPSCVSAKILQDPFTGVSRGYGLFGDFHNVTCIPCIESIV
jgi:hypothetical protein